MKKYIIGMILMVCITAFAIQEKIIFNKMQSFNWMLGTWKMQAKNQSIFESWYLENDSSMNGVSIIVNNNADTSMLENIQLHFRNGAYYYIPTAVGQNDDNSVEFTITTFSEYGFVAENPAHDFPKRISYRLENKDSIHAYIDGGSAMPEKRSDFYFLRYKK